jgi:7,8-dihydroneopterin aldolase/epimerase/oxygenase
MAIIALEGMHFHAFHGVYEEERKTGGAYIVDLQAQVDVAKAAAADDLDKTVNYEKIYLICELAMKEPAKLVETVAQRIAEQMRFHFDNLQKLKVRIRKKDPPLGGRVDWALVEMEFDFVKACARCNKPMVCYAGKFCWCMDAPVKQANLEALKLQYGDKCLCKECLLFFAG